MKFPVVTVTLVTGALIYVLWSQTREPSAPADPASFTELATKPAKRSDVVDLAIAQIPELCAQATKGRDSQAYAECVELADSRTSSCRRLVYDNFPDNVTSDAVFRDVSITMMNCLVRHSGVVQP
ncbi:hypothetical protein [Marinobacter sp. SS5-14b]|uniref:hypothetical protein n=1 Tax=Marinobacter sp. SS5-14b TaxID=3050456 RepID=UPI0026E0B1E6|nr:hypothetical protein [Marinobacter sp. SS5-14b]